MPPKTTAKKATTATEDNSKKAYEEIIKNEATLVNVATTSYITFKKNDAADTASVDFFNPTGSNLTGGNFYDVLPKIKLEPDPPESPGQPAGLKGPCSIAKVRQAAFNTLICCYNKLNPPGTSDTSDLNNIYTQFSEKYKTKYDSKKIYKIAEAFSGMDVNAIEGDNSKKDGDEEKEEKEGDEEKDKKKGKIKRSDLSDSNSEIKAADTWMLETIIELLIIYNSTSTFPDIKSKISELLQTFMVVACVKAELDKDQFVAALKIAYNKNKEILDNIIQKDPIIGPEATAPEATAPEATSILCKPIIQSVDGALQDIISYAKCCIYASCKIKSLTDFDKQDIKTGYYVDNINVYYLALYKNIETITETKTKEELNKEFNALLDGLKNDKEKLTNFLGNIIKNYKICEDYFKALKQIVTDNFKPGNQTDIKRRKDVENNLNKCSTNLKNLENINTLINIFDINNINIIINAFTILELEFKDIKNSTQKIAMPVGTSPEKKKITKYPENEFNRSS